MAEQLSQKELATRLDLVVRQIRNLEAQGLPFVVKAGRKSYPWPAAMKWYMAFKIADEVRRQMPTKRSDLELREIAMRVRLSELKVAEAEKQVAPLDVVARQFEVIHQQTAAAIRSLPQYAGEFVGLTGLADARLRCEKIANELLTRARDDGSDEDEEAVAEEDDDT